MVFSTIHRWAEASLWSFQLYTDGQRLPYGLFNYTQMGRGFLSLNTCRMWVVNAAQNTVISTNFLWWKFSENIQFLQSFLWMTQNSAETVRFHKILHQEIQWNFSILRCEIRKLIEQVYQLSYCVTPLNLIVDVHRTEPDCSHSVI